ncbi:MAG: 50S ribosomal protein L9 [Fimbriimonas sp.]
MKVILNQTVPKVGKEGTVVNVADGFARNYLFPRGLAIVATKQQIAALEKKNARISERTAGLKSDAEALRDKLNGQTVRIPGEVGSQGKLFGAITSANVIEAIAKQLGANLDKKQVALIEPIKRLGDHTVELDLHREVDARVTVTVYDPTAPVPVAPKAEETEEEEEDEY